MTQKQINKLLIASLFLGATFSAKPMYQPILEKTCTYLMEVAPEIASVGGSLALVLSENSRSENNFMEPQTELITNNSNGGTVEIIEIVSDMFKDSLTKASDEVEKRGCETF